MESMSSSTDIALRFRAPPFLSHQWRKASGEAEPHMKLGLRIELAERVTRFLVAVLASESRGLGLEPPRTLTELIRRLHKPTWGMWAEAARDLSRQLAGRSDLVASRIPQILVHNGRPAPAADALSEMIIIRNARAHHHGGFSAESEDALVRFDAALRVLCSSLRVIDHLPILSLAESRQTYSGGWSSTIRCFRGLEPTSCQIGAQVDIPPDIPFLLGDDGTALLLEPWAEIDHFGKTLTDVGLLFRWDGAPLYSRGSDDAPAPARRLQEIKSPTLFFEACRPNRFDKAVPVGLVERLVVGRVRERRRPELPGYQYERVLGNGGMGTVHLAVAQGEDHAFAARVAVKVLHRHLLDDPRQEQRFRREYEIAAGLETPGVVKVYRWDISPDCGPYIVMEHVDGIGLDEYCERHSIETQASCWLVEQLLEILQAAHRAGVVHRDLKPSNIMIDRQNKLRLLDFGIGAALGMDRLTRTLDGVGTTAYAAPEQLSGSPADKRADIYSAGRLLCWLLTGHPSAGSLDSVDPSIRRVVNKAIREKPDDRFQSADEMRQALRDGIEGRRVGISFHEGAKVGPYLVRGMIGNAGPDVWAADVVHRETNRTAVLLYAEAEGLKQLKKLVGCEELGLEGPFHGTRHQYHYAVVQQERGKHLLRQYIHELNGGSPEELVDKTALAGGILLGGIGLAAGALGVAMKLGLHKKMAAKARRRK